jgi:hypothetical protein
VLTKWRRARRAGHILRALVATAVLGGALAATSPSPHSPAGPGPARPPAAALSAGQAQARARSTGRPVTVSALTTPTSVTTANPGGTFTLTETAQPVRAWRGGAWARLDPALHPNRDGTISPAVTTDRLALSGGGSTPLAVMSADGRSLALSWPASLPAPTVSGDTATYPNVLPGVDLVVTADGQGGMSDVFAVKSAAAAANPALASLQLGVAATGLTLSADTAGNLAATAGPNAPPLYTAPAPLVWDSAPLPAGVGTASTLEGTVVAAGSGQPAASSPTAPGAAAHVASVGVSVSAGTLTLSPPASALTGPGVVYPVYIDPSWYPAGVAPISWTHVDRGFPTTSYFKDNGDLQVGDCFNDQGTSDCNNLGVARSFVRVPIPGILRTDSDVHAAHLYMTNIWAPSCNPAPAQLWTTGGIDSSTTWNNQPGWKTQVDQKSFAYGHASSCAAFKDDVAWDVTSIMQRDVKDPTTTHQTFGVRAVDEGDTSQWKQFSGGKFKSRLVIDYNDPPDKPTERATSPGGSCQYDPSDAPVIGLDDVTLSAYVSDDDTDGLTTRFVLLNADGSVAYDSDNHSASVQTGSGQTAELLLSRTQMQAMHATAATYHWYAISKDDVPLSSPQPADDCYFTYNPQAPSAPHVTAPAAGTLGQQVTATFSSGTPDCSATTCPVSFTYQAGTGRPVTLSTGTASCDASGCTASIPIDQIGPFQLGVYATAPGGNPGPVRAVQIQGHPPATAYPDGYFTGGTYPDLLTLGSGAKPSLWLTRGTGNGTVGPPVDIGSLGTGTYPGSDGPGDWAGATVTHGDFTGHGVQDVIAYRSALSGPNVLGSGAVIAGNGNASALVPDSAHASRLSGDELQNDLGDDPGPQLAGAGNASEIGTGTDDLIGVAGDPTDGYELDLYTNGLCAGCAAPGGYLFDTTLSLAGPGGSSWKNFTLATAQPGGGPGATVLFALNNSTGALWKSSNPSPGSGTCTDITDPACTLIGTPNSTWTRITVPWGSSPPPLVSADINHTGQAELWSVSGGAVTAYTLNGTALSLEANLSAIGPSGDWPMTDGSPIFQAATPVTSATDSVTGNHAALTPSGASWHDDDYFSTDVSLNGDSAYLTPPAGTIPAGDSTPSISVWFKTGYDRVLVSMQNQALSSGGTTPGQYDPVMYVGTDGKLYAEWWNGTVRPLTSTTVVDDGLWHHAVLNSTTVPLPTESLYIDGQLQDTANGSVSLAGLSHLVFGGGYIGGSWPSEPHFQESGSTGYASYFHGQIADITYTS